MTPVRATTAVLLLAALAGAGEAHAYIVNINSGDRAVYLRVGDGRFAGRYSNGGTPLAGGAISRVSVSVPAAQVGNGTSLAMAANGRTTSDWDGYQFCNAGQLYVGGFFRRPGNAQGGSLDASLTVTAPATLTNASGDTIPISEISWTSSGNGDGGATQPVPGGTFQGGQQTLASNFFRNTWRESCLSFRYANSQIVGAGTYTARVTYTLTAP